VEYLATDGLGDGSSPSSSVVEPPKRLGSPFRAGGSITDGAGDDSSPSSSVAPKRFAGPFCRGGGRPKAGVGEVDSSLDLGRVGGNAGGGSVEVTEGLDDGSSPSSSVAFPPIGRLGGALPRAGVADGDSSPLGFRREGGPDPNGGGGPEDTGNGGGGPELAGNGEGGP